VLSQTKWFVLAYTLLQWLAADNWGDVSHILL